VTVTQYNILVVMSSFGNQNTWQEHLQETQK